MIKLAADENLDMDIVRGLLRRLPSTDIVRVQDAGLSGADDRAVLAWAASDRRVIITHDVATMAGFAYERVAEGLRMPGVIEVPFGVSIGQAIGDLLLLVECGIDGEWEGQVLYLPLS